MSNTTARHRARHLSPHTPGFWVIYALSVLFTLHAVIPAYVNSSYMEQFVTPATVGLLYTISSAIAVLLFLFSSVILKKIGNFAFTCSLGILSFLATLLLGFSTHGGFNIAIFLVLQIVSPLIFLSMDIFTETLIGENEGSTGSRRGLALTLMSLAAVLATIGAGYLVGESDNFSLVYYIAASIFIFFLLLLCREFRNFVDPPYKTNGIISGICTFWNVRDVRNVFLAHTTLQLFFSWATIYIPLYLATEIGLPWNAIGTIIGAGLFAYVLFEYPVGVIADRYLGEKEMMALGFVVIAVSISWIAFLETTDILPWMILMFISRIGASLTEATSESYFFKHVNGSDVGTMSFFRLTRPLSGIIGPLIGSVALLFLPFNLIFIVLGLAMIPGIFFTMQLTDTK